jgi:hypothetical protein
VFTITYTDFGEQCTATENPVPTGYAPTSNCEDIGPVEPFVLGETQERTCTITNTPTSTTFTISKDFSDDSEATVSISINCTGANTQIEGADPPYNGSFSEAADEIVTVTAFSIGDTCTVTETPVPNGYAADAGCTNVPLQQGQTSCTVKNTIRGTIEVVKDFSDNNNASVTINVQCNTGAVVADDATASEGDPANFTITGYDLGTPCVATEIVPDGYIADQSDCQGLALSAAGSAIQCTIVNTARTATISVDKDFDDNNAANVTISLNCTSGAVAANDNTASEADDANFTVTRFNPGATCQATETVPAGYEANQSDCVSLNLVHNESDGCTIFNE